MFKRRLAVLGAVCALALTGLAGSALADEPPSTAGTAGGKVTCTTSDGKTIELPELQPGKPSGVMITPDGEVKKVDPEEIVKQAIPAEKLPEGAKGHILVEKRSEGDAVPARPAEPAELADGEAIKMAEPTLVGKGPEGEPGKKVTIICKKPE